jgi:hypothetical protein
VNVAVRARAVIAKQRGERALRKLGVRPTPLRRTHLPAELLAPVTSASPGATPEPPTDPMPPPAMPGDPPADGTTTQKGTGTLLVPPR